MKVLLPLTVAFLGVVVTNAQTQTFYFPDARPSSHPNSGGELLGNFFNGNGNLPSITTASTPQEGFSSPQPQPQYTPRYQQPATFTNPQPPTQQFGNFGGLINSNYLSAPVPTSSPQRPRQTSFFGNNYDFFRQFHLDAPAERPAFRYQPFGAPSYSSNVVGNSITPSSPTASPSFKSTQIFTNPNNPPPTQAAPAVVYNFNNVKPSQFSPPQNALYNGFEDAAKSLGVSPGIRVVTTETLKSKPVITVGNFPYAPVPITSTAAPSDSTSAKSDDKQSTTPQSPRAIPAVVVHDTGKTVATVVTQSTTPTTPFPFPEIDITTPRQVRVTPASVKVVSHSNPTRPPPRREPLFATHVPSVKPPQPQSQRPTPTSTTTTTTTTRLPPSAPPQARRVPGPPSPSVRSLYNANNLLPGHLYTNTNGAYQVYYGPGQQQHHQQQQPQPPQQVVSGLEEIEPQIIDFNFPLQKMVRVRGQVVDLGDAPVRTAADFDSYTSRSPFSYSGFDAPPPSPPYSTFTQVQPRPVQEYHSAAPITSEAPVVIVTEASVSPTPINPETLPTKVENGQVYRVGPKGRLLKKRRKVRLQKVASRPAFAESRPTTYRPVVPQEEDEDVHPFQQNIQPEEPVTTYRSRFRFSTTTTTAPAEDPKTNSEVAEDKSKIIASRLKSLERQIRFKNRAKNS